MTLSQLLVDAAQARPLAPAVVAPDGTATYGELDRLANGAAYLLRQLGVGVGERVGLYAPKGLRVLALMQGALRVGAVYVPIDPANPPVRAAAAFAACDVSAIVAPAARLVALRPLLPRQVREIAIDDRQPADASWTDVSEARASRVGLLPASEHDLAYVLYTSGSTGASKGVCISHRNALAFVEWAVGRLGVGPDDRFANHAPYNFDLSVFDIYGAFLSRGTVVTVPEDASYLGHSLAEICRAHAITVWYSVPTALTLMLRYEGFVSARLPSLRIIIFAGEVFPIKGVRALRQAFPRARLFNFYGPTETNVCTAYEVNEVADDRVAPLPIGSATCGNRVWAVTPEGRIAGSGETGELSVAGPTVAQGYWARPFTPGQPYRTGDWVRVLGDGSFDYIGRRDRMVKVRGRRIELGEVESALSSHPAVTEAAVVVRGEGPDARLVAYLVAARGADGRPTLLTLKRHCASLIPPYMSVADAHFVDDLPRTANGKVDYLKLARPVSFVEQSAVGYPQID